MLSTNKLLQRFPQSQRTDRKSTRLNSSHTVISYAVFCLKKKKKNKNQLLQDLIVDVDDVTLRSIVCRQDIQLSARHTTCTRVSVALVFVCSQVIHSDHH